MRHRFGERPLWIVGLAIAAVSIDAEAQVPDFLPSGSSAEQIIEKIEEEGRAHPPAGAAFELPYEFTTTDWIGSEERLCVTVSETVKARSGEFVIGGRISELQHNEARKVWWAPLHNSDPMKLVVRARQLDPRSATSRFESDLVARPSGGNRDWGDVNWFFPSGYDVPSAGRWALVATTGANWGCFIVEVA